MRNDVCRRCFALDSRGAAFYMQIVEGAYYKEEADGNRIRTMPVQAVRGVMYDRNGVMLAGSRAAYTVVIPVDRKQKKMPDAELDALAVLLNMPKEKILEKLKITKLTSARFR